MKMKRVYEIHTYLKAIERYQRKHTAWRSSLPYSVKDISHTLPHRQTWPVFYVLLLSTSIPPSQYLKCSGSHGSDWYCVLNSLDQAQVPWLKLWIKISSCSMPPGPCLKDLLIQIMWLMGAYKVYEESIQYFITTLHLYSIKYLYMFKYVTWNNPAFNIYCSHKCH